MSEIYQRIKEYVIGSDDRTSLPEVILYGTLVGVYSIGNTAIPKLIKKGLGGVASRIAQSIKEIGGLEDKD